VDPCVAETLMLVILPLGNALQVSFAVLLVVVTATLVALGIMVAALASMPMTPTVMAANNIAAMTFLFNFN